MKGALGLPDPEGHSLGGLQCGEAPATGLEPEPGRRDTVLPVSLEYLVLEYQGTLDRHMPGGI